MDNNSSREAIGAFARFLILAAGLTSLLACGPQLKSTRILPEKPLPYTSSSSYPNLRTVYESDEKIVLVSNWNPVTAASHRIRWELFDSTGEKVFVTREFEATIRPHMFHCVSVRLKERIKNRLNPGTCQFKMYLDDELKASISIDYAKRSILNHNINGAVVLPFRAENVPHFNMKPYLNTVSNAVYGEVNRIVENSIPPSVSEKSIGEVFYSKNSNDARLMKRLSQEFRADLLISGSLCLSSVEGEVASLTVDAYNKKIGHMRSFISSTGVGHGTYSDEIIELIAGVLYEKGFLSYLKALK